MKDDLVDQCVRALEEADSAVSSYEDLANAVLWRACANGIINSRTGEIAGRSVLSEAEEGQ